MSERMLFVLAGRDDLSRVLRGAGDQSGTLQRQLNDLGRGGSRALADLAGSAGSAGGALGGAGGGGGLMASLKGVGVVAALTALPAIGALVPMLVGLGAVGGTAALAMEDIKKEAKKLKPEFEDLQKAASKAVMPGVKSFFKDMKPVMKDMEPVVKIAGGAFSDLAKDAGKVAKSPAFQKSFMTNVKLGTEWFSGFGRSVGKLGLSLLDFGSKSKPTLDALGGGINDLIGKGLPGFFKGLEGGIKGSAEMFTGLFNALNKILPALGEFAGAVAKAAGPALREIFESFGDTASGALRGLGKGVAYLKPLFGEMAGFVRSGSIALGAIGSIAKQAGTALLESLWPGFRGAKDAVGPMQNLAKSLKENKGAIQEFTRVAAGGILDFVGTVITYLPEVIRGFRIMSIGILGSMDVIISGAAKAFGWIPGIGGKLRSANRSFDRFKNGFISGLQDAENKSRQFANEVAPRLERNKLKMNISNWESQIRTAKGQMKSVPPEKRAKLRADIRDLQAKIRRARGDLASLHDKTVRVHVSYSSKINAMKQQGLYARGGRVRGYAGGGDVQAFPQGGFVSGPGTGTSDSIMAMFASGATARISNTEYVIRAAAVRKYGVGFLDRLNAGRLAGGGPVGYASGGQVRKEIPGDLYTFVKAMRQSAGEIRRAGHGLAHDLEKLGRAGRRMAGGVERASTRLRGLATRRDAIGAKIAEAKGFASTVVGGARQAAGLSSLFGDENQVSAGGIKGGLQAKLAKLRTFSSYIRTLAKRGIHKTLLRQILEMGPEQGYAYASSLAGASKADLDAINGAQVSINRESKALGLSGADLLFDSGRNAGRGFLRGLEGQQKAIEDLMMRIAKGMQKSIKRALGIRSPSAVMAKLGAHSTEGLAQGLTDGMPVLDRALTAVSGRVAATRPVLGRVAGAAGAGGGNVYITVQGALDPLATARQIQKLLLKLKRDSGVNVELKVA